MQALTWAIKIFLIYKSQPMRLLAWQNRSFRTQCVCLKQEGFFSILALFIYFCLQSFVDLLFEKENWPNMDNLLQIYPSTFIPSQIHSDYKKRLHTDYVWGTVLGAGKCYFGASGNQLPPQTEGSTSRWWFRTVSLANLAPWILSRSLAL